MLRCLSPYRGVYASRHGSNCTVVLASGDLVDDPELERWLVGDSPDSFVEIAPDDQAAARAEAATVVANVSTPVAQPLQQPEGAGRGQGPVMTPANSGAIKPKGATTGRDSLR